MTQSNVTKRECERELKERERVLRRESERERESELSTDIGCSC